MNQKPKVQKQPIDLETSKSSRVDTPTKDAPSKWIRIEQPLPIPGPVKDAIHRLNEAGYLCYVVGGGVRDFLLGRKIKDHDLVTDAHPDRVMELFPDALSVGKQFGVIKIPTRSEIGHTMILEIATFRSDGKYVDYRHPQNIKFSNPTEDARRRDFTINALFYNPKTQSVLDTVDGVSDLKARVIRAIGDPTRRFQEDALRLLRAIRFASTLEFEIDPPTWIAVQKNARLISKISSERVRDEITLLLQSPKPGLGLKRLAESGLLKEILPEMEKTRGLIISKESETKRDVWSHTLKIMDLLASKSPHRRSALCWAAFLHDVGKPVIAGQNNRTHFNGHEQEGIRIAETIGKRLRLSREEIATVVAIIGDHLKFKDVFNMREATLLRWIREPHYEDLLALHEVDAIATDGNLAYHEFCKSRLDGLRAMPGPIQLINGEDLIQLGFLPGPRFSQILSAVEDLALEKKLITKEEALEFVIKNFVS